MRLAYPEGGPYITGLQTHYTPGDYIIANCTAASSNPAPELDWYINGAKVSKIKRLLGAIQFNQEMNKLRMSVTKFEQDVKITPRVLLTNRTLFITRSHHDGNCKKS